MSLFARLLRRQADPASSPSAHVEIWSHLLSRARFDRFVTMAALVLVVIAEVRNAYTQHVALTKPLVYYVDSDGRAVAGGRAGDSATPLDVEARYVAKRFLRYTLGLSSLTAESDFAEAWNLMTVELQEQHNAELAEYAQERGQTFIDYVKQQQIRTTIDIARLETERGADGTWTVRASGRARTWPLSAVGEQAGFRDAEWEAALTLAEVPRTELVPSGLLVSHRTLRFFEPTDEARAQEGTLPRAPAAAPGAAP